MKWLILILGPNNKLHCLDDLKEKYHTNIIVILVHEDDRLGLHVNAQKILFG